MYTTAPTNGILTARRNWISGSSFAQSSMGYDAWGNVTSQTTWTGYGTATSDPTEGAQTTYTCYGGGGSLGGKPCINDGYHTYALWTKNAKGHVTNVAYDYALGLPVSETDPNGATTSATYDSFGRFTGLTRPGDLSPTLNVSYQNSPFKVTLTQAIDTGLTFTVVRNYDGMGRQTSTVTNDVTVTSTFDAYGRVLTQTMPGETAHKTITTYDALGRPLTMTAPDNTVTTYGYNGLSSTVTDARSNTHTTVTDILGRTLSATPPTGPAVTFQYYPTGNLWTATRGGATMTLTYDNAGRKLTMSDPDMGNWSYEYDALGSMTYQTDARDCVTHIEYDELNRPTDKTYSNCPATAAVAYDYDQGTNGKGRRTSMTDGSGSTNWFYDPRGRVWKETKVISGSSFDTEWTYNSADLPKTMKYPDGEIVTTHYNNNMLPIDVIGANTYVSSMTYDSASRLLTRALGNGLTQTYDYYDWNQQGGRLETLVTGSLQNLAYVYDPVGNISQITNSAASETSVYGYDALDRLTSWQLNQDTPETYEYDDDTGNLIEKNDWALDYPAANGSQATHPHAVTSAAINDVIVNTYGYDQNGNQTTREIGPDTFDLTYDAENRLVEVEKNDVTIAQFTFDGDGKRVKSVMDGETILFAGSHYEKKGSTITKYYMAGASRVAMRKYTIPQNMEVEYLLGDHLGSTSLTTDANGVKISELRYKPWGETRYEWTDAPATTPTYELTKYQYTGQYSYDTEFGLKFYNARWLDSATGRFVQADTVVPKGQGTQAWDRYAYTSNNPLRYNDPSGHRNCEEDGYCPNEAIEAMTVNVADYDGEHVSLGTRLSATRILTHNHYDENPIGMLRIIGQPINFSDPIGSTLNHNVTNQGPEQQTRLFSWSGLPGLDARLGSPEALQIGSYVRVAYWDDNALQISVMLTTIKSIDVAGGFMTLNDPNSVFNKGDSGGGVFFNGQLVGNNWYVVDGGGVMVVAIVPPPPLPEPVTPVEIIESQSESCTTDNSCE